ncbi:hypothetical protein PILCRDRAFT_746145 [Piloderma croceum F 1598]|uniref:Uncharacterized protein n=1 Tax=Piloderma croceum (strain F 1598) TaxID=765440 RepID=A0A0C3B4B9_PILCF|nr:hypothetical protein PILCRDRAFT_746145 [Piloderma croceum F 1598]
MATPTLDKVAGSHALASNLDFNTALWISRHPHTKQYSAFKLSSANVPALTSMTSDLWRSIRQNYNAPTPRAALASSMWIISIQRRTLRRVRNWRKTRVFWQISRNFMRLGLSFELRTYTSLYDQIYRHWH